MWKICECWKIMTMIFLTRLWKWNGWKLQISYDIFQSFPFFIAIIGFDTAEPRKDRSKIEIEKRVSRWRNSTKTARLSVTNSIATEVPLVRVREAEALLRRMGDHRQTELPAKLCNILQKFANFCKFSAQFCKTTIQQNFAKLLPNLCRNLRNLLARR